MAEAKPVALMIRIVSRAISPFSIPPPYLNTSASMPGSLDVSGSLDVIGSGRVDFAGSLDDIGNVAFNMIESLDLCR